MDASQLQKAAVRLQRTLSVSLLAALWIASAACTTLPEPKFRRYFFPESAFTGDVKRPYETLGLVKTKVDFPTLDPVRSFDDLCSNYYNKAVADLLRRARQIGADAVIDVKSVVFLADGRMETHSTPECVDDGEEGQVLTQGIAIRWKKAEASPR